MIRFACQHARNEIDWMTILRSQWDSTVVRNFSLIFLLLNMNFSFRSFFSFVFLRYSHLNFIFSINFENVPLEFAKKKKHNKNTQQYTNLRGWKTRKNTIEKIFFLFGINQMTIYLWKSTSGNRSINKKGKCYKYKMNRNYQGLFSSLRSAINAFAFFIAPSCYWCSTYIHRDPWRWLWVRYAEYPHFHQLQPHKVPYQNMVDYRFYQQYQYEWILSLQRDRKLKITLIEMLFKWKRESQWVVFMRFQRNWVLGMMSKVFCPALFILDFSSSSSIECEKKVRI